MMETDTGLSRTRMAAFILAMNKPIEQNWLILSMITAISNTTRTRAGAIKTGVSSLGRSKYDRAGI
jgi:hypothetical protein